VTCAKENHFNHPQSPILFDSIRLDLIGFESTRLDSIRLDWIRLDWIRGDSSRVGSIRVDFVITSLGSTPLHVDDINWTTIQQVQQRGLRQDQDPSAQHLLPEPA